MMQPRETTPQVTGMATSTLRPPLPKRRRSHRYPRQPRMWWTQGSSQPEWQVARTTPCSPRVKSCSVLVRIIPTATIESNHN